MGQAKSNRITPRSEDYSKWYHDVVRQGDLAEPAEVVKGCMVIKPHGYAIWERIQRQLDDRFKATGHQNAYFPLLIPQSFINKEAEHVEGFSPELAVVTHAGGKELEEPYVIRPTSETVIGHFFSRWIESHRDLPLLINQWANVMRWEMRTRMFLRTSEFLWQEGHTAHATHKEAQQEVLNMLDVYADFVQDWMAVPVIRGVKSECEKFAGALKSYCIESLMQDGKALQMGTSHDLGQNFGKAFDVKFQAADGSNQYVWQTSWGVSTRLVGGLIMAHSDDSGLVLPPKLAPIQCVLLPILNKHADVDALMSAVQELKLKLEAAGLRVFVDKSDHKPGYKFHHWEQKGVPLRIELGPRDLAAKKVCCKMRLEAKKEEVSMEGLPAFAVEKMKVMQEELFARAKERQQEQTFLLDDYDAFKAHFKAEKNGYVWAHWDGTSETELKIKDETKATIRCLPFEGQGDSGVCMVTGEVSAGRVVFAKAY